MMGYFVVINAFNNHALTRIRHLIEDFIVGNRFISPPPVYPLSRRKLELYSGTYETVTYRFPSRMNKESINIGISSTGDRLIIHRNSDKIELIPVTASHFRYQGETVATSAFIYDDKYNLYFQDEDHNYMKLKD